MTMRIKKYLAVIMAGLMAVSAGACSFPVAPKSSESLPEVSESEISAPEPEPADPNWPVMIGDAEIKERPETVVCLSPELTEHIGDLGMTDRLAAVSDYCSWPEQVSKLPKAGTAQSPNYNAIDQLSPDYVIAQGKLAEADLVEMQQRNITVVQFPPASSLNEVYGLLKELALFFDGKEDGADGAQPLIDRYETELAEITAAAGAGAEASGTGAKKAAYIRVLDYTMASGGTLEGELLAMIAENPAVEMTGWEYDAGKWADFSADILFVSTDTVIKDLEQNENYKNLQAVYNDAVYQVDMDVFARGGLRTVDMLRVMAATVWPEQFPDAEPLPPAYPSVYKEA